MRRLREQLLILGRRGTLLAGLGVIWVCTGVITLLSVPPSDYLLLSVAIEIRAGAWIVSGFVAIAYSRRAQGDDAPGFLALYIMPAYRVLAYGTGVGAWLIGLDHGTPRGIVGVLAWLTVIVLILVVAGWPEPGSERTQQEAA